MADTAAVTADAAGTAAAAGGGGGGGGGKGYKGGWGWGWMMWGKGYGKGRGKGRGRRVLSGADPTCKVWIGNVPEEATWKELEEHMNQVGKSKWTELLSGKGKGTAVVLYSTAEEAQKAISDLNGSEFKTAKLHVDVYVKQEKEEKPAES
eukprot:TRINITY_DN40292_c1_g1_i2.p2 TRINITY_DN40292_c1_g1~~TRINITY_DN40292_c1_g1_i2.p2  ORF type:complete len:150 (+),score=59.69 TRINITY_DN40292_c1_g1_i2:132-581(+)